MEIVPEERELIYVGDPMCSWCWGIAPELDELMRRRPELEMRIVVGGLRPGPNAREVDDRMAAQLAHHWRQVAGRTGQPFDHSLIERRGWIYDTEPPCRAVVVMREHDETLAWPLFKRLQHLFYAEGVLVSDPAIYRSVIEDLPVDTAAFMEAFESQAAVKATWRDFATAHNWGIRGFPTIIARTGRQGHVVAQGWTSAGDMELALERVFPTTGDTCEPGGDC